MGEGAVREVTQVYERIKIQQPLLLHCSSPPATTQLLAHNLLSEALRALNLALSVMKQQQQQPAAATTSVKAEPQQLSPPRPSLASADDSQAIMTSTARSGKRRRSSAMEERKTSPWVDLTTVPYEDGYEWRKYGEKKINGTRYTRSYFRCTYKDDTGCLATKHVQQRDTNSSDPPMFQVTYNNHHTCSKGAAAAAAINIKQEQPPPVLIEVSAALPFDGTPPLMTSPCISGESWDEYSAADMAEASAGHDLLYDPELFVLCTSFKVY